ncbi:hypothetical protein BB560_000138, partial [Smittium megazygosporum]
MKRKQSNETPQKKPPKIKGHTVPKTKKGINLAPKPGTKQLSLFSFVSTINPEKKENFDCKINIEADGPKHSIPEQVIDSRNEESTANSGFDFTMLGVHKSTLCFVYLAEKNKSQLSSQSNSIIFSPLSPDYNIQDIKPEFSPKNPNKSKDKIQTPDLIKGSIVKSRIIQHPIEIKSERSFEEENEDCFLKPSTIEGISNTNKVDTSFTVYSIPSSAELSPCKEEHAAFDNTEAGPLLNHSLIVDSQEKGIDTDLIGTQSESIIKNENGLILDDEIEIIEKKEIVKLKSQSSYHSLETRSENQEIKLEINSSNFDIDISKRYLPLNSDAEINQVLGLKIPEMKMHILERELNKAISWYKLGSQMRQPIIQPGIQKNLKVDPKYVCRLPINWPVFIENSIVTLFDANHCPGSVMYFFDTVAATSEYPRQRILHTGDFRACPDHIRLLRKTIEVYDSINVENLKMPFIDSKCEPNGSGNNLEHSKSKRGFAFYPLKRLEDYTFPAEKNDDFSSSSQSCTIEKEGANHDLEPFVKSETSPTMSLINKVYLDTTYMNSNYAFPAQKEVVDAVVNLCVAINKDPNERLLHVEATKKTASTKTIVKSSRSHLRYSDAKNDNVLYTDSLKKYFKQQLSCLFKVSIVREPKPIKMALFVVGTYLIGKERLFIVLPMVLKNLLMEDYLDRYKEYFHSLVAFRPTGWTFQSVMGHPEFLANPVESSSAAEFNPHKIRMDLPAADEFIRIQHYMDSIVRAGSRSPLLLSYELGSKCVPTLPPVTFTKQNIKPFGNSNRITIFPVPYSEHSSYRELAAFICSIACEEIIPTVNSHDHYKAMEMEKTFALWNKAKWIVNSIRIDFERKISESQNKGSISESKSKLKSSIEESAINSTQTTNTEEDNVLRSQNQNEQESSTFFNSKNSSVTPFPKESVLIVPTR